MVSSALDAPASKRRKLSDEDSQQPSATTSIQCSAASLGAALAVPGGKATACATSPAAAAARVPEVADAPYSALAHAGRCAAATPAVARAAAAAAASAVLQPRPPVAARSRGGHTDLSLLALLITTQQPAPGSAPPLPLRQHDLLPGSTAPAAEAGGQLASDAVSSRATPDASSGPCRTDMSGEAVLVSREISSRQAGGAGLEGRPPAAGAAAAAAPASAAGGAGGGAGKPKRKKSHYVHGNYHNYYGYRRKLSGQDYDPRLAVGGRMAGRGRPG